MPLVEVKGGNKLNLILPRPDGEFTTAILFVKAKNSAGGNTIAYYHNDHLGTPIQATDRSGIIVWSAQYNAFGQATLTTPTATDDKPVIVSNLRFPGQVEDAETGLYYNWHRYYDPEIGRYVTADPIGLYGGLNWYAYVDGDPVNAMDSLGLRTEPGLPPPWNIPILDPIVRKCNAILCFVNDLYDGNRNKHLYDADKEYQRRQEKIEKGCHSAYLTECSKEGVDVSKCTEEIKKRCQPARDENEEVYRKRKKETRKMGRAQRNPS
jgi:RHS repeat-associated protein